MKGVIKSDELMKLVEKMAKSVQQEDFSTHKEELRAHADYPEYRDYLEKNWLPITEVLY